MLGLKYLGQWNKWGTIPWITSGCQVEYGSSSTGFYFLERELCPYAVWYHVIGIGQCRDSNLGECIAPSLVPQHQTLQLAKIVQGQVVGPPLERSTHIAHPHLLVRATNERFLSSRTTFRVGLANENHKMQPMLVLTVHWWRTSKCGWAISVRLCLKPSISYLTYIDVMLVSLCRWVFALILYYICFFGAFGYWQVFDLVLSLPRFLVGFPVLVVFILQRIGIPFT